jgi:hypothetical protein
LDKLNRISLVLLFLSSINAQPAAALDETSTVTALRLSGKITGGSLPPSDPLFSQMVAQIQAGNPQGAALTAANSRYFANYFARRFAWQMQTPALDATASKDSDATAFLIAHFTGAAGTKPSISTIWSENQTYVVNVTNSGVTTPTHANLVANPENVDWYSQLTTAGPQTALDYGSINVRSPTLVRDDIPAKHVGGYTTASYSPGQGADLSFAQYGLSVGTNLRFIEGIWEISTGFTLVDAEDTTYASTQLAQAQTVPRFVPENNSNFYVGQGQAACIECHGGGMSSLKHGYSTVADVFDYPTAGIYFGLVVAPAATPGKSLGSNVSAAARAQVAACNLTATPTIACNPDSPSVDPNQGWDLSSWQSGFLSAMGWRGPVTGAGLNALGVALGQAKRVYQFMTARVIGELCPVDNFSEAELVQIVTAVDPLSSGTDDLRTIVAMVAASPSCQ